MLMRKKNDRKAKEINEEIVHIRTEMADKINLLARKGNIEKCFLDPVLEKSKNLKIEYCQEIKNIKLRLDCMKPDGFCYSCCENEIGETFVKDREDCYDRCDKELEETK